MSVTPAVEVEAARVSEPASGAGPALWYTVEDRRSCDCLGPTSGAAAMASASICGSCKGSNPRAGGSVPRSSSVGTVGVGSLVAIGRASWVDSIVCVYLLRNLD